MDPKLPYHQEIERLTRVSAMSRSCLQNELSGLKQRLDFPSRLHGSLKSHPTTWLVGSLASGFAASLLFRRRSVPTGTKPRGLALTLLGLALTAVRPFAKVWLADQVKHHLIRRPGTNPSILPGTDSGS